MSAATGERSWSVLELLRWTTQHFASKGIDSPRLDAECLLAFALGVSRLGLYLEFEKPASPEERARFRELVMRRAEQRVPVAQLVGQREFWSLSLIVSPDVLVPRPETELLVEAALERLPDPDGEYRVLDLGTGSGAIALAIAKERPKARMTATDISFAALQIARANAEELHLSEGIRFLEGELFSPVRSDRFDLVVSNPPYLSRREAAGLEPELAHEPALALFGGEVGDELLRALVADAPSVLEPGGWLIVELDPRQSERVAGWCEQAGLVEPQVLKDLSSQARAVAARAVA